MRTSTKRLFVAPTIIAALFLGACGSPTGSTSEVEPFDLKNDALVAELCGETAVDVTNVVIAAENAKENSGKRKRLEDWGVNPSNSEEITAAKQATQAQTQVECGPDGKALSVVLTAEQEEAAKICLTAEERTALQPDGDATTAYLLERCKAIGAAVYDKLSSPNKAVKTTADLAKELKETDKLTRAAFIVTYMNEAKKIDGKGVTISDTEALAAQITAMFPNADKDDVRVGSKGKNPVDHDAHTVETGSAPFYNGNNVTYLDTTDAIATFLAGGSDESKAANKMVTDAIKAAGYGDDEVARARTGAGYLPVQLKEASQILGTSYFVDGKVKVLGQWRQSKPGELYWLYISEDGMVIPDATLRADCGNVKAQQIRIVKPGIAPAPSVTQLPGKETCPQGTVLTPNGECHVPAPAPKPVVPQQPVVPEQPHVPEVTLPPVTPVCPPGTTGMPPNCLEIKIPAQDPAPRGNSGNGGGLNQDPGPGTYVPPEEMEQPPAAPYTPPPAPAPQPAPVTQPAPGGGGETVVIPPPNPNPEGPRPTAPPEEAAPEPSEAPTTCVPAPGKTTC